MVRQANSGRPGWRQKACGGGLVPSQALLCLGPSQAWGPACQRGPLPFYFSHPQAVRGWNTAPGGSWQHLLYSQEPRGTRCLGTLAGSLSLPHTQGLGGAAVRCCLKGEGYHSVTWRSW